jgi:hypothetical protein
MVLINWSKYFAITILVIVILVLIGWQWDITFFKRPIPHRTAMSPLTASAFLLAGTSVGLFSLLGYQVQPFSGAFTYTPMAAHTAACFFFLFWMESHPGEGTTLFVTVPLTQLDTIYNICADF